MTKYPLFFLLIFYTIQSVFAQDGKRPKVGLVLSGGGAKGLAHIGIIRALEEAGLTPDYVTGTSMGGIVGGLYAIGYTADEIEEIALSIDWESILSNKIPLNEVAYEEKEYYGRYMVELPIYGTKVGLPRGLIDGQKLSELLSRLTRSVHDIEDFNELPIPFACVATDIATGEPMVLNHGSLPEAIRASMAIPTFFTPVELDGRLLVDGGLVRNFPVDEIKAMGADIVIGVFVSSDLNPKDELNSLISLLSQSALVTSALDSRKQKKLVDIYIEPDLEGYQTISFKQGKQILEKGDEAGQQYAATFRTLADSLRKIGPLPEVHALPQKEAYLISEIVIEGNEKFSSDLIKQKMKIKEGTVLTLDEIENRISNLIGTQYFKKATYEIVREGPKYELKIKVKEASDGKLKIAAHYDSENDVGINASITYRNLFMPQSRTLLEFDFSKSARLNLSYLKYIGPRQDAGIALGFDFSNNDLPYFEGDIELSTFDADYFNPYLTIQSTYFQNFTFGGTVQLEFTELTPVVGELTREVKKIKNRDIGVVFFAKYNSFDRPFYPRKGMDFHASAKSVLNVKNKTVQIISDTVSTRKLTINEDIDPFVTLEASFTYIFRVNRKLSIRAKNEMVLSTLGDIKSNITDYSFVGGFNPRFVNTTEFWGASDKQYITPNYFMSKLVLQYEVVDNLFVSAMANYVDVQYPMELFYDITLDDYLGGERRRLGYGISFGYNSPFGPISFSMAKDTKEPKLRTNLNMGFWF